MAEAAVVNKTDDTESMRIALADRVKEKRKELEDAEKAALASAKPKITDFAAFLNKQNGLQVGKFNIRGENLRTVGKMGVSMNGLMAVVTSLRDDVIKGIVPPDLAPGAVKIKAGDATFEGTIA